MKGSTMDERKDGEAAMVSLTITPEWVLGCLEGALQGCWSPLQAVGRARKAFGRYDRLREPALAHLPRRRLDPDNPVMAEVKPGDLLDLLDSWMTEIRPPDKEWTELSAIVIDLDKSVEEADPAGSTIRVFVGGLSLRLADGVQDEAGSMRPRHGAGGRRLSRRGGFRRCAKPVVAMACGWHGIDPDDGMGMRALAASGENLISLLQDDLRRAAEELTPDDDEGMGRLAHSMLGHCDGDDWRLVVDEATRAWTPPVMETEETRRTLADLWTVVPAALEASARLAVKEMQGSESPEEEQA